ncbi:hypothetical protein O1611_g1785 [Lasiodiplodia mahajangana]|uniref:Uncharacterized protein n=1 Tax=Lasiodiplodia mahajangana TaxID=1108764 RepID=A0ACC2JWD8_9PEZI|nr:hypothetical protein O1611_g1785 [Lasiodiplodia mahajangana]
MVLSSVLLDSLLPCEGVGLGRLVLDIRYPYQDFSEPEKAPAPEEIITQRLEQLSYSSEEGKESSIHGLLSDMLSGTCHAKESSSINLSSATCFVHQLRDSAQFFEKICRLNKTRKWLECAIRSRKDVFLVTGIRTVCDTHLIVGDTKERKVEGNFEIPISSAALAAGIPVPNGILNVGAGGQHSIDGSRKAGFFAPGEQIFAVQYRKIHISWLKSRDMENATLKKGNQWKVYMGAKGETGVAEQVVDLVISDYVDEEDPTEPCKIIESNGEKYLRFEQDSFWS